MSDGRGRPTYQPPHLRPIGYDITVDELIAKKGAEKAVNLAFVAGRYGTVSYQEWLDRVAAALQIDDPAAFETHITQGD